MMTVDEYERAFPLKDPTNNNLLVRSTQLHTGEIHKYTVNKKGIINGIYRIYAAGRLVEESDYKDGMRDGIHLEWDPRTGYLSKQCNYKNNMLHGEFIEYDVDGYTGPYTEQNMVDFIAVKCNYVYNQLHGAIIFRNIHTGEAITRYYMNGLLCVPKFRDARHAAT